MRAAKRAREKERENVCVQIRFVYIYLVDRVDAGIVVQEQRGYGHALVAHPRCHMKGRVDAISEIHMDARPAAIHIDAALDELLHLRKIVLAAGQAFADDDDVF